MRVFWRKDPLTEEEEQLLSLLEEAHYKSAFRMNASTAAVINSASGSGDYIKAITAGLMTIGHLHGPIQQTHAFLSRENPAADVVEYFIPNKILVPGWGNSFVKGEPDSLWLDFWKYLIKTNPKISDKIMRVTESLYLHGKNIYPNPSTFTAAVAIALGIPEPLSPYLFIMCRIPAWTEIIYKGGI